MTSCTNPGRIHSCIANEARQRPHDSRRVQTFADLATKQQLLEVDLVHVTEPQQWQLQWLLQWLLHDVQGGNNYSGCFTCTQEHRWSLNTHSVPRNSNR